MSQYGKTGEQSMEEILASIRSSVDTPESASAGPNAVPKASNGAGVARAPEAPVRNESGRLQDALLNVVPAAPGQTPPQSVPQVGLSPSPKAPPSPSAKAVPAVKATAQSAPPSVGNSSVGDDDLSDLFVDATAAPTPTPAAKVPPSETVKKISAATFGTVVTSPDTLKIAETGSSISSQEAAALVKPTSIGEALSEVPKAPATAKEPEVPKDSEVITTMDTPSPSPSSPSAPSPSSRSEPSQHDVEPKPKREPSFAALKTLASGTAPEKVTPPVAAETSDTSSVLLPERRDLPSANPEAQKPSMAAVASQPHTGGFIPARAPKMPDVIGLVDDPDVAPAEITGSPRSPASQPAKSESTSDDDAVGIAPSAHVEATAGSRSLEDIVVELLKPQLAQWLEANMPRIVERALRAEQSGSSDKKSS